MDFTKWYRKTVESANTEPPPEVWEEIQNELDLDNVWQEIEKELPAAGRRRMLISMAAAASIIILIGLGTILFMTFQNQTIDGLVSDIISPDDLIEYSNPAPAIRTDIATITPFPPVRHVPGDAIVNETHTDSRRFLPVSPLNRIPFTGLISEPQVNETPLAATLVLPFGETNESTGRNFIANGFYAGLSGHLANTWLVNNKTLQGLKSDEFTSSLPSFGYSVGITAGRKITQTFDIQAEIHLISLAQQNYNEYLHGKYVNNNMQFSYSSLSLSGKWYFNTTDQHGRHSILFGAYKGFLRNVTQRINEETLSLSHEYDRGDYGIVAGYEYLHPFGNGLSIGTGLQSRFGLNNIFSGNDIIPGYLNRTRNASINITISLRYNPN